MFWRILYDNSVRSESEMWRESFRNRIQVILLIFLLLLCHVISKSDNKKQEISKSGPELTGRRGGGRPWAEISSALKKREGKTPEVIRPLIERNPGDGHQFIPLEELSERDVKMP